MVPAGPPVSGRSLPPRTLLRSKNVSDAVGVTPTHKKKKRCMFLSFDDTRLVLSAAVRDKILPAVPSRLKLKNHGKRFDDRDVRNDVTVL